MKDDDRLFDENDVDALLKLVNIVQDSDAEHKLYDMSLKTSDVLNSLISSSSKYSADDKKKLQEKLNKREKNQVKVEDLSLHAKDIRRGKEILEGIEKDNDRDELQI